jgi:hypothetical protein
MEWYKLIHLLGILMLFSGLSGVLFAAFVATPGPVKMQARLLGSIFHGVGLILVLLGGVGMAHRLGLFHGAIPYWLLGKMVIFVYFGMAIMMAKRRPWAISILLPTFILLGGVAAYLALFKPF